MREIRKYNELCLHSTVILQIALLAVFIADNTVIGATPLNTVPHFRSRDELQQRPPQRYKYSYNVHGQEGDQHGHQVSHDGPYASGKYYVKLNQGTSQNVEYYTDHLGYHPKVMYRSHLDSGKSGTRVILGGNAADYPNSGKRDSNAASNERTSTSTEIITTLKDIETTTIDSGTSQNVNDNTGSTNTNFESIIQNFKSTNPNFGFINPNFGLRLSGEVPTTINETAFINNYFTFPQNIPVPVSTNDTIFAAAPVTALNTIPLAQQSGIQSTDAYLQPEINEITNGFLGKLVSVVPGIKLLRPIIVTDNNGQTANANETTDIKSDQAAESAQQQEYREDSPYAQLLLAGVSIISPKNETTKDENAEAVTQKFDQELEKPKTIVDVEPQMVEEQAVITTTVDISKSLPLQMNFLPDIDNNLNEFKQQSNVNYVPNNEVTQNQNSILPTNYPSNNEVASAPTTSLQVQETAPNFQTNEIPTIAATPHQPQVRYVNPAATQQIHQYLNTFIPPQQMLYNTPRFLQLQLPPTLPSPAFVQPQIPTPTIPGFRYVPIPLLQHQPNIIPLNFAENTRNSIETGTLPFGSTFPYSTLVPSSDTLNQSTPTAEPTSEPTDNVPRQETITKRENHSFSKENSIISDFPTAALHKPSFVDPLLESHHPYAYQVPASQLIPYVKQITNSPNIQQIHPYTQYLLHQQQQQLSPQQQQLGQIPARAHSVSYNVKLFPKEHHRKPPNKLGPFKPSHPLWDSIYPPQHMYYVPYYVVDKIPNERKARDSSYRRNQRRVRRLFVEYGGFKPPMIPSTLLEVEDSSDKSEVPKNSDDS